MLNLEKINYQNSKEAVKKAAIVGTGIGMSLGSPAMAQSAHNYEGSFVQDQHMENIALRPLRQPEDYDIAKTAKIDLTDLEEKKNLDPSTIGRMAMEIAIQEKIRNIWNSQYGAFIYKSRAEEKGAKEQIIEADSIIQSYAKEMDVLKEKLHSLTNTNYKDLSIDLDDKDRAYLEMIPDMIRKIEKGRQMAIDIIKSPEYLSKLQTEFDCSPDEAARHQQVRLANVNLSNYYLKSNNETVDIFMEENPESTEFDEVWLYDAKYDNIIYANYEIDTAELSKASLHEFLHKATRRNLGLSPKAIGLLKNSYSGNSKMTEILRVYKSIPTERYVMLKIVEMELEEKGIKKVTEKFTREHFDKMIELWKDQKLPYFSSEFIYNSLQTTNIDELYRIFEQLFNEIAENNTGKTYYHSDWDYKQTNEQENYS